MMKENIILKDSIFEMSQSNDMIEKDTNLLRQKLSVLLKFVCVIELIVESCYRSFH